MSSAIQRMLAVVVTASIVLMFAFTASAQAPSRWVRLAPFPEPEEELYGADVNGKMYVLGGFGRGNPRGLVYAYDPATDQWTKKKPMPHPVHHQGQVAYNGKIYMFGGFDLPPGAEPGWYPVNLAWEYDPAADTWKALAPMPGKRGSPIAAEVGGKIYVIGGATPDPRSRETGIVSGRPARAVGTNEVYDPATNRWESRNPMPTARNHAFSGVVDGKIYVIGGRIGHSGIGTASNTDVVEQYDPATDVWLVRAPMPTPRSGGDPGTYMGRIYVAGGEVATRQMAGVFRAVEAYDPATNTWSILPSMPTARKGVAGAILGNRFHLVSGFVALGNAPDTQAATGAHEALEITD